MAIIEIGFLSPYPMFLAEYLAILESRNDAGHELRMPLARAEAGVSSVGLGRVSRGKARGEGPRWVVYLGTLACGGSRLQHFGTRSTRPL